LKRDDPTLILVSLGRPGRAYGAKPTTEGLPAKYLRPVAGAGKLARPEKDAVGQANQEKGTWISHPTVHAIF
jgi:hypothetical protein